MTSAEWPAVSNSGHTPAVGGNVSLRISTRTYLELPQEMFDANTSCSRRLVYSAVSRQP